MPEVGGVFTTTVSLSTQTFTELFAPAGEQIKITMSYAKTQANGEPVNSLLFIAPASGGEASSSEGTDTATDTIPPIGGNVGPSSTAEGGLQPIYITDSEGLYIGNFDSSNDFDVLIRGVRVA